MAYEHMPGLAFGGWVCNETAMKVAFQGERGAYSEEACRAHFGDSLSDIVPCPRFRAVYEAVASGQADRGMVPVENSTAGSIQENFDLLLEFGLVVVGEQSLRVRHHLLALPGETIQSLRQVLSHPQALAQCDSFLRKHSLEPVAEYDTAGSAKLVATRRAPGVGAIASRLAGTFYGLVSLAEGIESNSHNYTRFLALSKTPAVIAGPAKTSLLFATVNAPGTLYRALGVFASRQLNVTKLESRPTRKVPWEYVFYLDFEGHAESPSVVEALEELKPMTAMLRVLGSYPAAPLQLET
jgi:prephenate dehydratase